MLLSLNPLVMPDPGLFIWSAVSFVLFCIIIRVYAWRPILAALEERERSIEDALTKAELAKEEMAKLTSENEQLLKQARMERDAILKSAKELKDQIVSEAKNSAQEEGAKMIEKARQEITAQKVAAVAEVKNQISSLSIDIAEKILRKQFEDQARKEALVSELLKEVKLN